MLSVQPPVTTNCKRSTTRLVHWPILPSNDRLQETLQPETTLSASFFELMVVRDSDFSLVPSDEGGEILFKTLFAFSDFKYMGTNSSSIPAVKRITCDGGGSTASERSSRDPPDDSQSFKMRLVYRDKGCAVCLAAGIQAIYKYCEDSNRYEGAHIIAFTYHSLWDAKRFSALVRDPFTDPANADSQLASPSTRTKKDFRRINSLENGILLCSKHHKDYDNFRFSIHPQTHKIFAFHPTTAALQGVEVKAPWDSPDVLYPPPLPTFLGMHYVTSVVNAMKANRGDYELDIDDEDYEDSSELEETQIEETQNEQVRIWLDGLSPGTSSFDFIADNKGNIETLVDMREVVSV